MIYCIISVMAGIVGFLLGAIIGHADGYDKGVSDVYESNRMRSCK